MKPGRIPVPGIFSLKTRMILGGSCVFIALIMLIGAWSLPFLFESPTMYYKFGVARFLLRSGKIVGITAAFLIFLQVLPVSRFKLLDRIFSLNRLYHFHRINGLTIAVLITAHPLLVLGAESFTFFPLELRYWPEFAGIALLMVILGLVTLSNWRTFFKVPYHFWRSMHRGGTMVAIAAAAVHILFVSDTFSSGLPLALVIGVCGLSLLLILRIWYRRWFTGVRTFAISKVERAGKDVHALEVRLPDDTSFAYLPGQFAFITPLSAAIPREEHPFTVSSTPSRPGALQFTIRSLGDWTSLIGNLEENDTVIVDGPYGLFSHLLVPKKTAVVFIAGGIGITPVLSMLRYMADTGDQRKILLIWSNRTKKHIVYANEFTTLKHALKNLKVVHVLTREKGAPVRSGRLDRAGLAKLLKGYGRADSAVFVCGPPQMMQTVSLALKSIGFSSRGVYKEAFQL